MRLVANWVWRERSPWARLARIPLAPAAALLGLGMRARAHAYRNGLLPRRRLPRPTVSVGNLTVGGTGKTPVASWFAGYFAARGMRPAVLLRGGRWGDEALVHRQLQPGAIVVTGADRVSAANEAVSRGADVLILDDGYQRLDVVRDVNVLLVSTESFVTRRLLPAGPWREGLDAITRADVVVVTRKSASRNAARVVAGQLRSICDAEITLAHLRLAGFRTLRGGAWLPMDVIRDRAALVSAGVANPESLVAQLEQAGARVTPLSWPDHHRYTPRDTARIVGVARNAHVIVTEKDAVKLRDLWPRTAREPLVAQLEVCWDDSPPSILNETTYE